MAFDYEAADTDDETVRAVAAEMAGGGLKPLSEEEIALREIEREVRLEETRQREEQWRLEHQQQEAAKLEAAQREAAIAAAEANRKARQERAAEIEREARNHQLCDLQMRTAKTDSWQQTADRAMRNAAAYQQRQTLMNELEAMINPPAPPPEPTLVYVEAEEGSDELGTADFNIERWSKKPRSWW